MNSWKSHCSKTDFMHYKENSFINNSKPVICGNNTTGLQLSTNIVNVMQCIFSLLGAMKLELAFMPLKQHSNSQSTNVNFDQFRHIPSCPERMFSVCMCVFVFGWQKRWGPASDFPGWHWEGHEDMQPQKFYTHSSLRINWSISWPMFTCRWLFLCVCACVPVCVCICGLWALWM